jgi:hypothetical protein
MMRFILSIFFALLVSTLFAQSWAPVGTKWTYSFTSQIPSGDIPSTLECIGDTVIQDKNCRIFNQGFLGWGNKSYLYSENDKIYIYVNSTEEFHLLYDFTAKAGESWQIVFPPIGTFLDSSIIYVDSIGTSIISGDTFSVQYVRNLTPYLDEWQFGGKVYKNIGNINYFFPQPINTHVYFGPLRCYQDSFKSIKFSTIPCDTAIIWNLFTPDNYQDSINIYPNPVREDLTVEFKYKDTHDYTVDIYSSLGKKIIALTGKNNRYAGINEKKIKIPFESLSSGVYYVKVSTTSGKTLIHKIIKAL